MQRRRKPKKYWGKSYVVDDYDGLRTSNIVTNQRVCNHDWDFSKYDTNHFWEFRSDGVGGCVSVNGMCKKANGKRMWKTNIRKTDVEGN